MSTAFLPISSITNHFTNSYNRYINTVTLSIATGIVVLASLAWNNLIQAIIQKYYPNADDSITGKLQYALIITFIVIMLQMFVFPYFIDTDTKKK